MTIPRDRLVPLLETMLLMRRSEEKMCEMGSNEIFGVYHSYIGQEATGASVMAQLGAEDAMFSTHRNHGHNLAKGVGPEQLFAEMMLRQTGASSGKGGTQHVMSRELKTVASSILGGWGLDSGRLLRRALDERGRGRRGAEPRLLLGPASPVRM